MSLPITEPAIANAGDLTRERVVFQATEDLDLSSVAIFCCRTSSSGGPIGWSLPAAFWLPNKRIKKDDFVVLYTKSGKNREKAEDNGQTSYFYYWTKNEPVWVGATVPVVVKLTTWKYPKLLPQDDATG